MPSHVTSATVLLASMSDPDSGKDAVDLTSAVTRFLVFIDRTRDCMRAGLVVNDMTFVRACARYWREVGLHVEIGMQQSW